jgi:hypothetical protein
MTEDSSTMEKLAEVLERLAVPRAPAPTFKPPRFNGTGNVEIFIRQFTAVAEANQWSDDATLLHLQGALKDEARDCGGAEDVESIQEALRARYGLTAREARSRLTQLRKDYKTPLQEHAAWVEELMKVAYPDLGSATRTEMAVDHFTHSLGNASLQRHLLAVKPDTLTGAVRAGNEYLQVKTPYHGGVKQVEEESPAEPPVLSQVQADPMVVLTEALTKLSKQMSELQGQVSRKGGPRRDTSNIKCFTCGKLGHFQSKCPEKPQTSGNAEGQQ